MPKVTQIQVYGNEEELQLIEVSANHCANVLKVFDLNTWVFRFFSTEYLMKQISGFVGLEKLRFTLNRSLTHLESLTQNMKIIGKNCTKIKELDLSLDWESSINTSDLIKTIYEFFPSIKFEILHIF